MGGSPRRWWIAGLLSLLFVGLGQMYNGRRLRAGVFLGVQLLAYLPMIPLAQAGHTRAALAAAGACLLVILGACVEAVLDARRNAGGFAPRPFHRVAVFVALVVALLAGREWFVAWVKGTQVQALRIPSPSMSPTFLTGDYLFADMRPSARAPSRGDLVIVRNPLSPRERYLKRAVALAGQTVEIRDKRLVVDGQPQEEPYVTLIDPGVRPAGDDPRDNLGPFEVPPGSVFVLGDNRDNSRDSRHWGPVPGNLVLGRPRGIYWSWDADRFRPRWERIGRVPR